MLQSDLLTGLTWQGARIPYPGRFKGDTFPITWADDDVLYSSAGDTVSEEKKDGLNIVAFHGDTDSYTIDVLNPMLDFTGWGGAGLKPTGMLCRQGVLYLFAHNLGKSADVELGHGYDAQVFCSFDKGKTWQPDLKSVEKAPMFPGRSFGSPAFINYGKDHQGATDRYVYALSGVGWANGDYLVLGRVNGAQIMNRDAWRFVSGMDSDGAPIWSEDVSAAKPVLEDVGFLGCPEAIYVASIKRYLVFSWHFKVRRPDKWSPDDGSELAVYESPNPWGPFSVVAKLDWENEPVTPYNPRVPLKWFNPETLEGVLLFSGSWRDGGSSEYYRAHVRRFRLERPAG